MPSNQARLTHQVRILYAQFNTPRRSSTPEHSDYWFLRLLSHDYKTIPVLSDVNLESPLLGGE